MKARYPESKRYLEFLGRMARVQGGVKSLECQFRGWCRLGEGGWGWVEGFHNRFDSIRMKVNERFVKEMGLDVGDSIVWCV